jgi:hypothetical protein
MDKWGLYILSPLILLRKGLKLKKNKKNEKKSNKITPLRCLNIYGGI